MKKRSVSSLKQDFEDWYEKVDLACIEKCGMGIEDLPDCCFMDWFEDGVSPKSAASRAIKAANDEN